MDKLFLNHTDIKAFDTFECEYISKVYALCPLLTKFHINVFSERTTSHLKDIVCDEESPLSVFIEKNGYDASSTYAEIIVFEDICKKLFLTEQDFISAIAHEVGHIILFFNSQKDYFSQFQYEEFFCDNYAYQMGLGNPLRFTLTKLIKYGNYPPNHITMLEHRINLMDVWNKIEEDNEKSFPFPCSFNLYMLMSFQYIRAHQSNYSSLMERLKLNRYGY